MNELETLRTVRRALDVRAERLPYRVTHRLELARTAALGRMPAPQTVRVAQTQLATAGGSASGPSWGHEPSLSWRIAAMVVPIAVLVAGLLAVSVWNDFRRAEDVADVDTAVLLDDVPISVYADKGFGVYLRNNQR